MDCEFSQVVPRGRSALKRIFLVLLLTTTGCDESSSSGGVPAPSAPAPPAVKCADRFRRLHRTPWAESHLAFNTVTGQMCRSWNWSQPNNAWRIGPENTAVCSREASPQPTKDCPDQFQLHAESPWTESHLASDTKTGQVCRTWDWEQPNMWGITRANTPTCESLVKPAA